MHYNCIDNYPPLGSSCFDKHLDYSLIKIDSSGTRIFARDKTGVFGVGNNSFKINFNDFKPFVSLKIGRFETYLGWREKGNLGGAMRVKRK